MSVAVRLRDLPRYTIQDYEGWEGRWELIAGLPFAMSPSPVFRHQRISNRLARMLDEALDDCPECQAVIGLDWRIDLETVVCPDHAVVCGPVDGRFLTRPPALAVEILSPSTSSRDRGLKHDLYEAEGVGTYWIVDLDEPAVEAFVHDGAAFAERRRQSGGPLRVDLGPCSIEIDLDRLWKALP